MFKRILKLILVFILLFNLSCPFVYGQQVLKEDELFFAAKRAFEEGYYEASLGLLNRFAKDYPESSEEPEALILSGRCYLQQNRVREAIKIFEGLIKKVPSKGPKDAVYYWLGESYLKLEEKDKASYYYRLVLDECQNSDYTSLAGYSLGWIYFSKGDFKEALKIFKGLQEKYSSDPFRLPYVYFYIAEAEYYLENFQEAVNYYLKAISSKGNYLRPFLHLGLGWSYLRMNKGSQAGIEFDKVDESLLGEKERRVLFSGKAEVFYSMEEYDKAISLYYKALDSQEVLLPQGLIDRLRYNLALALAKKGRYSDAVIELKKIYLAGADEDIKFQAILKEGDIYQSIANYPEALKTYELLLGSKPKNIYDHYAQYQIGMIYLKLSDYDAAIKHLQKPASSAVDSETKRDALYALAFIYSKKEEYLKAVGILEKLTNEIPESGDLAGKSNYLLADIYYGIGDFNKAILYFSKVINNSQDISVLQKSHYFMSDSLFNIGKEKEAVSGFNSIRSRYPGTQIAAEAAFWLGGYYYQNGQQGLSRRYFLSIVQDYPDSPALPEVYYSLALSFMEESRVREAIDYFSKAFAMNNAQAKFKAAVSLGDIKFKRGEFEQAVYYYDAALKSQDSGDPRFLFVKIAEARELQGKPQEAIEYYLKAGNFISDDKKLTVKAILRAAKVYEDLGQQKDAELLYQKIISMGVEESSHAKENLLLIRSSYKK